MAKAMTLEQEAQLAHWNATGQPAPPPHIVKVNAVRELAVRYGVRTLIETGTFLGDMIDALKDDFASLHSIELGADLYTAAVARFADCPQVKIHPGDSGKVLPQLLRTISERCLFWLDGHWSMGITARGELQTPISAELEAILTHRIKNHIVLIDDIRLFDGTNDYPRLEDLRARIEKISPQSTVEVAHDILRITPRADASANANPGLPRNDLDDLREGGLWKPGAPLKLHLGCGETQLPGYINLDFPPSEHKVMKPKADGYANIIELDFPDGSVDEIRLHHVFEHFPRVVALGLLLRWHRWLKIGGGLHIETPDLEGSAKTLLAADAPLSRKLAVVRHLAGDQADAWAYHIDHWFPARFQRTLSALKFDRIATKSWSWPHEPFLSNVEVLAIKTEDVAWEDQIAAAAMLLRDSMVAAVEEPMFQVWKGQLRDFLEKKIAPKPNNIR